MYIFPLHSSKTYLIRDMPSKFRDDGSFIIASNVVDISWMADKLHNEMEMHIREPELSKMSGYSRQVLVLSEL
jgi:hypothetical protein